MSSSLLEPGDLMVCHADQPNSPPLLVIVASKGHASTLGGYWQKVVVLTESGLKEMPKTYRARYTVLAKTT
jgi:hypothetical protein